jgi:peptidoglycan/LPS O-acetylase OafA/YrhL
MKDIRALTALRGVAAIWVFLLHLDLERPLFPSPSGPWHAVGKALAIGRGYIAVDLFFALSGFVLALNYRAALQKPPFARAYRRFLLRRVARVMPLNAAVVASLALLAWLWPVQLGDRFPGASAPWTVLANVLLIQDWGLAPSIDKPAWSVSIEMAVYLACPLLFAWAWSRRFWSLLALAGAAALAWLARDGQGIVSQGLLRGDVIRGVAGFGFGALCCRAYLMAAAPALLGRLDGAIVALFWAALLLSPTDFVPVLICPAIVLALAFESGPAARLLSAALPYYLGRISYAIYLVHFCVLQGLAVLPRDPGWLYPAAAVALTLALSIAAHHGIERPARRWIVRRSAGRTARETVPDLRDRSSSGAA